STHLALRAAAGIADTNAAAAFKHEAFHHRIGLDAEVCPRARRVEIAPRRAHASAAADRSLRHGHAVLVKAVVVPRSPDPDGLGGGEAAVIAATSLVAGGDLQRPLAAADLVVAAGIAFHAAEDRQYVLVAPAAVAELCPMIVVLPLAAHPHHPVDGARAS